MAEFNLHATSVTFKLLGAVHILDAIVHTLVNSINLLPNWSGRLKKTNWSLLFCNLAFRCSSTPIDERAMEQWDKWWEPDEEDEDVSYCPAVTMMILRNS